MGIGIWTKRQLTYKPTEVSAQFYEAYEVWWDAATQQPAVLRRDDLLTLDRSEYETWLACYRIGLDEARADRQAAQGAGARAEQLAQAILVRAELRAASKAEQLSVRTAAKQRAQAEARTQRQAELETRRQADLALRAQLAAERRAKRQAELEARRHAAAARRQDERAQREQLRQDELVQTAPERAARREAQLAAAHAKDNARQRATRAAKKAGRLPRPAKVETAVPAPVEEWQGLIAMNLSPATVKSYRWQVVNWLEAGGQLTDSTADVVRYLAARRAAGIGEQNIKQGLCALLSFFNHVRPGDNPTDPIPWPRMKRRQQRALSRTEAQAVIASCDTATPGGVRDLAFLSLAIDTGLRNAELRHLTLADLDLVSHSLAVIIKGGDERAAVFSESTAHFLANWLEARKSVAAPDTRTVFCSIGGLTPGKPLTDGGLRCICRYIGRRAGLAKVFSPHALRRTMALLATRAGAPANVLMAGGRWTNEGMLKIYLQDIDATDFSKYSPVNSLLAK